MPSSWAKERAVRGSGRTDAITRTGSPNQERKASRWWIDMIRSVTQPSRSCQGIQWGIARISIVASTGSPSVPAAKSLWQARTAWSNRMF
jgi:hypothetical protein